MFLNQYEMQRYIQASAKRANLSVKWQHEALPHTNGDVMVLPILPASATLNDYRKLLHYANHESDHVLYTDFKQVAEKNCHAGNSFLGFIWNGVEDVRIEWLGGAEYEGDRANTDEVYPSLFEKGFEKLAQKAGSMTADRKELMDRVLSMLWFMNEAHRGNYASAALVTPQIEKHLSPEAKAFVTKFQSGDYLDVMKNIREIENQKKGTDATYKLARRIFEEVYGLDADEEEQRLQEQKEQQQQSQDGKGQSQKGSGQPKPKAAPQEKGDGQEKAAGKGGDDDSQQKEKGKGGGDAKDEAKPQEDGEGKGEGSDGQADGEQDAESDSAEDSGRPGKDDASETRSDKLVNVKYEEFLPTNHEHAAPELRDNSGEGMHIDYEGADGSCAYIPATRDQFAVADFCRNQHTNPKIVESNPHNEQHFIDCYRSVLEGASGPAFASRVRVRLQIRSRDRFERGVKKGKLQGSLLHRVPRNDALSERVFKRKIVNDTLDTAVTWLGDCSGSMNGSKYSHLMAASVQFNEAVGNVIGIPIEVLTFTDFGGDRWTNDGSETVPLMYVHRDFNTRRLGEEELVRRLAIAGQHKRANADGDSILWAYDRLMRRREKRKLLIVASDGQPSTTRHGDIDWFTCKVVDEIQRGGQVQIVGIGILDDNVQRIYKEHYVINDAGELERALLALIDKKVR